MAQYIIMHNSHLYVFQENNPENKNDTAICGELELFHTYICGIMHVHMERENGSIKICGQNYFYAMDVRNYTL